MNIIEILFLLTTFSLGNCVIDFAGYYGRPLPTNYSGSPLFLTSLLENGNIDEAKQLSEVKPLAGQVKSYSGFLTVNKTYNSNIFFWFFPAEMSPENAPVLVWLQGGPGASSMFGLFSEHGPFIITDKLNVTLRQFSWTKSISVLYIDNPVGTGYSFTDSDDGYAKSEDDYATNLYETIRQFYLMFPELLKNDFYVAGESYGGKYAPALAYRVHEENKNASVKINLKGVSVGNGFCDPVNMLNYGDYLLEIGLIDQNGRDIFVGKRDEAVELIKQGKWVEAFRRFDCLLNNDLTNSTSVFTNLTGYTNYYNYLKAKDEGFDFVSDFIQQDYVRDAIHVGNLTFHVIAQEVEKHMEGDVMKSVAPHFEVLLENYRMLVYNGQLDIIVAYPLTLEFLKQLKWSGSDEYKTAKRDIWKIKDQVAGYSKTVRNLNEVLVRNAGHMVPSDQPLFAFDLINRFVFGKSFASY
ncbi:venom serine carboxypeptidase-like [Planococcus citri]|uniref:venom serine carboxypeptidase-like n=1 Tax=Planococcus citri TaxID=170843 RepID=UPI0031F87E68